MTSEPKYVRDWMLDLMDANPKMTGTRARKFARQIIQAEFREDYRQMNALIHEAVYGAGVHEPAA